MKKPAEEFINPNCEYPYDQDEERYRAEDVIDFMENGPHELDYKFREGSEPPTKVGLLGELMEDFFDNEGAGKAYETNALAEALGPDPVTVQRIKETLGKSADTKAIASLLSKGATFVLRSRVFKRNVWSSEGIAAARREGDTSAPVVKGVMGKRRKPIAKDVVVPEDKGLSLKEAIKVVETHADDMVVVPRTLIQELEEKANLLLTVQGVDNSNISRHPIPNAARVDCGQCGGSGKVYMKQEPKS